MKKVVEERLQSCGLEMHPVKTRIVYCKDSRRTGTHEQTSFEFLGYTFRPRSMGGINRQAWTGFTPAVSRASMKAMRASLRASRLHLCSSWSIKDLAAAISVRVRGWMRYYCRFRASAFQPMAEYIDGLIVRWAMRKFKRLRGHKVRAHAWLNRVRKKCPTIFAHWCGVGRFQVGTMGAR